MDITLTPSFTAFAGNTVERTIDFIGSATITGADSAGDYIVAYYWFFGDGQVDVGQIMTHIYPIPGAYTVTLQVIDRYGNTNSISLQIVISAWLYSDLETRFNGLTYASVDATFDTYIDLDANR